jgi:hypothetical protein
LFSDRSPAVFKAELLPLLHSFKQFPGRDLDPLRNEAVQRTRAVINNSTGSQTPFRLYVTLTDASWLVTSGPRSLRCNALDLPLAKKIGRRALLLGDIEAINTSSYDQPTAARPCCRSELVG